MQASDYLRMKFQSDRHLAEVVQRGFVTVVESMPGVVTDIYSGFERVSWYSSCLIPKYNEVCRELKDEEIRTFFSIQSIFEYHDVIAHMIFLYLKSVSDDIREGSENGSARKLIRNMTGLVAHMKIAGGTRYAFATAASVAMSRSGFMSKIVVERLSAKMPTVIFAIQIFGIQQNCALAARHLKTISPGYYEILYDEKLEMLYYFVEPILNEMIQRVKSRDFLNLDELTDFLQRKYGV
ncbi:hypothetical protein RHD99_09720 [Buttiauxella selenatireducens]|uniref:Uncharacterized protein n=1 Tax=Buttiauxella selenatireducens TaxID=3073902 RepID=A0ABY9SFI6_9ENTR|nr:hypothetical protein [Buttiauxella sp. R73]WMY76179.1 hypothetical protein RHD99_09720 [Buttiauxella sp. R73]